MSNIKHNSEIEYINKKINLLQDLLKKTRKVRIKNYEDMKKEDLIISLLKSK